MIAGNDDDDYSAATGCTVHCNNSEISQMSPISSQSLIGANSASRGAREGFKKRKFIRI